MSNLPGTSSWIYGVHEIHEGGLGKADQVLQRKGWIVTTHALGHVPHAGTGFDYSPWAGAGYGVIARLNHGYGTAGTLPRPQDLPGFVTCVREWVANSKGCGRWIVGNEPNHRQERPDGIPILPAYYKDAYIDCREVIRGLPGHGEDEVIVAAIAPWNVDTPYEGNETGDWIRYFQDMLSLIEWDGAVDAIALHTYTHGADPFLVMSEARMDPPYQDRYYHFLAYRDFMRAIPHSLRHVPVYVTETDQDQPWRDRNSGWVRQAYAEIDAWNVQHPQSIRCLALYRWPKFDDYYIDGKANVQLDLAGAIDQDYKWTEDEPMPEPEWTTVYQTSMEAFYPYQGQNEVKCPVGSVPLYEHTSKPGILPRPEYAPKIYPQPEVRTRPNSAGFFVLSSTMEAALVWRVQVTPGQNVRAGIWAMGVEDGSGLGMRLGIATQDPGAGPIENPASDPKQNRILEQRATWGGWWSIHDGDWQERVYKRVETPVVAATGSYVWVLANARADWAGPGAHSHWDDLTVEVQGEAPEPPEPEPPDGCPTLDEIRQVVREEVRTALRETRLTVP